MTTNFLLRTLLYLPLKRKDLALKALSSRPELLVLDLEGVDRPEMGALRLLPSMVSPEALRWVGVAVTPLPLGEAGRA